MKIIVIIGATGSGKTELAYKIAFLLNLEIINVDAFQVYKEINQGTNKPSHEMMNKIRHHLINNISIYDDWNIKKFKDQAEKIIDNSSKPIIVSGGSSLYIHALLNNYNLLDNARKNIFEYLTNEELFQKLYSLDEIEAIKIGKNNRKCLSRAIEIILNRSILKSDIKKYNNKKKYDSYLIFLNPNREKLYEKIDDRTEVIFNKKIIDEINSLDLERFKNTNASHAIGYKTIIENNMTINDEILNKIKQESRNYAKKQISWCKNKFDVNFITNNYERDFEDIINNINIFLKKKNV